jgi:hypothetical protein
MSTPLKWARFEFSDGPLKNHGGFIGQGMGSIIEALDLRGGYGRYVNVGKTTEDCFEEGETRVVYLMRHVLTNGEHVHPLPAAAEVPKPEADHPSNDSAETTAGSGLHDADCSA